MSTLLTAPAYSSVTIYLDDDVFQELFQSGHLTTAVNVRHAPIQPSTYIHVHNHKNGHITAYVDSIEYLENEQAKISMSFVMNLTVP